MKIAYSACTWVAISDDNSTSTWELMMITSINFWYVPPLFGTICNGLSAHFQSMIINYKVVCFWNLTNAMLFELVADINEESKKLDQIEDTVDNDERNEYAWINDQMPTTIPVTTRLNLFQCKMSRTCYVKLRASLKYRSLFSKTFAFCVCLCDLCYTQWVADIETHQGLSAM